MREFVLSVLKGLLVLSGALVVVGDGSGSPGFTLVPVCEAQQDEADSCVRNMVWDAYPEGWAVRTITSAKLDEMEHRIYMLTLYAGNEYRIIACGDRSMVNVDLVLYDSDGRLIKQDEMKDRQPILLYKPEMTDTYYVAVHATERTGKGKVKAGGKATIALAVTYR